MALQVPGSAIEGRTQEHHDILNLLKTQVRSPPPTATPAPSAPCPPSHSAAQAVLWHLDAANFDYDAYLEALDRLLPRPEEGRLLDAATVRENILRNSLDIERVVTELAGANAGEQTQEAVRSQTITATLDRHYGASAVVPRLHSYVDDVMSSAFGPPVLSRVRRLPQLRTHIQTHTHTLVLSLSLTHTLLWISSPPSCFAQWSSTPFSWTRRAR